MSDFRQTPDVHGSRGRSQLTLVGIVIAFALYNVSVAYLLDLCPMRRQELLVSFMFGGCAAQALLIGLWTAIGPGSPLVRLPLVCAAAFALTIAFGLPAIRSNDATASAHVVVAVGGIAFLIIAASSLVGAFAGWWTRQSIQCKLARNAAAETRFRFSMKYLLRLTTLVAILTAVAGGFLRGIGELPEIPLTELILQFGASAGVCFAVALPTAFIPWAILSPLPKEPLIGLGVLFWLGCTGILGAIIASFSRGLEPVADMIAGQIGSSLVGTASASALHWAGYRLMFHKQALAEAGDVAPPVI